MFLAFGRGMAMHRMFQVIVLGGVAITSATDLACGGSLAKAGGTGQSDASPDAAFPTEGPANVDSGFPTETAPPAWDSGFPTEGPADAGFPAEGPVYLDSGFPTEGPNTGAADAKADAELDGAFPQEGPGPK
jgi:hypothetical protein